MACLFTHTCILFVILKDYILLGILFALTNVYCLLSGLWCGGWTALNDNCRVLSERNISRVVSVISTDKRELPKSISHHLHIQVHDTLDASLLPHFPRICLFIEMAREANASVLIHCGAGISRAPSAVAACLMKRYRLSAKDALRLVKNSRPSARPNISFVQQLVAWQEEIVEDTHHSYTQRTEKSMDKSINNKEYDNNDARDIEIDIRYTGERHE